jgi:hypothetical protein
VLALPCVNAAAAPFLTLPEALPGLDAFPVDAATQAYYELTHTRPRCARRPQPWELSHFVGYAVSIQDDTRYQRPRCTTSSKGLRSGRTIGRKGRSAG